MATTIKGGCYRLDNGEYVNAAREKLTPAQVRAYHELRGLPVPSEFEVKPKKTASKKTATKKSTKTEDA